MTIDIPAEYEEFLENAVRSGGFHTKADVVREALRLFQERQRRIVELREELRPALERLDRGEGIQLDDESLDAFFEDIKTRGHGARDVNALFQAGSS